MVRDIPDQNCYFLLSGVIARLSHVWEIREARGAGKASFHQFCTGITVNSCSNLPVYPLYSLGVEQ